MQRDDVGAVYRQGSGFVRPLISSRRIRSVRLVKYEDDNPLMGAILMPLVASSRDALYFNEIDHYAADWLQNLWPRAVIDRTDIRAIRAGSVRGRRCHFFAGIGGWEYALHLADWPPDLPVWTGSCPCQPFSTAGRRRGIADDRHLWPIFYDLIKIAGPTIVLGEQVAGAGGLSWLAGVRADMEEIGYAFGAGSLPAACVGAPHRRDRLFWGAIRRDRLGHPDLCRKTEIGEIPAWGGDGQSRGGDTVWDDYEIARCGDGFTRRVEPGLLPVAHGVPHRVGRLRAYGNAIVPQAAALFVRAFMGAVGIGRC